MRRRTGLGDLDEFDFYEGEFYDIGGGYGGGGSDLYFVDDSFGYGGGGVGFDAGFFGDYYYSPGVDEIPYAPYEPEPLNEPNYQDSGSDLYFDYLDYYLGQGYDTATADQYAWEDSQGAAFQLEGEGQLPVEQPPIVGDWWNVPYTPLLPPMETPPYTPYEPPAPEPPPLPQPPATQQPNLPPACPGGQYHPYPLGHPQQNVCVPFPAAPQQQPRPQQPQQAPRPPAPAPRPQQQQQQQQNCPTGYCKHPTTGQCMPIPAGYTRDAATQRCVPQQQQQACPTGYWPNPATQRCEVIPQCAPGLTFDVNRGLCVEPSQASNGEGDILSELGKLPWWLWAGLGAFLLLGKDDESDGRKTTVTYKRA